MGGYKLGLMAPAPGKPFPTRGDPDVYRGVADTRDAFVRLWTPGAIPHEPVHDVGKGTRLGTVTVPSGQRVRRQLEPALPPPDAPAGQPR